MLITIDLPDNYVVILSKWASVSRTLKGARQVIEEIEDVHDDQRAINDLLVQELHDITPALDALHQVARAELWKKRTAPPTRVGLCDAVWAGSSTAVLTMCALPKGHKGAHRLPGQEP